jgi:hypothetical protein
MSSSKFSWNSDEFYREIDETWFPARDGFPEIGTPVQGHHRKKRDAKSGSPLHRVCPRKGVASGSCQDTNRQYHPGEVPGGWGGSTWE